MAFHPHQRESKSACSPTTRSFLSAPMRMIISKRSSRFGFPRENSTFRRVRTHSTECFLRFKKGNSCNPSPKMQIQHTHLSICILAEEKGEKNSQFRLFQTSKALFVGVGHSAPSVFLIFKTKNFRRAPSKMHLGYTYISVNTGTEEI